MDAQVRSAEGRLDTLTKALKEREQENRVTQLKIKELRRVLKHNQLMPL